VGAGQEALNRWRDRVNKVAEEVVEGDSNVKGN